MLDILFLFSLVAIVVLHPALVATELFIASSLDDFFVAH
jgi:hypothetical protein